MRSIAIVMFFVVSSATIECHIAKAGCNWVPEAQDPTPDKRNNVCASLDKDPGCRLVATGTIAITAYATEQYYVLFSGDRALGTFPITDGIPIDDPCALTRADLDDKLVFLIGEPALQKALRGLRCIKRGYYARTMDWDCALGRLDFEVECVK